MGFFDLFSNETKQRDKLLRKFNSKQLSDLVSFLSMHCFECVIREPLDDEIFIHIQKTAEQIKTQYGVGLDATKKLCDYAVECKRNGKLKEAIAFYGEASQLMPTRSMTYYSLGKTLYLSNQYYCAISAYTLAYIYAQEVTYDLYRHTGHAVLDDGKEDSPNAMEYRVSIGGLQPRVIEGKQFYAYKLGYESNDELYIKKGKEMLMNYPINLINRGVQELIDKMVGDSLDFISEKYLK